MAKSNLIFGQLAGKGVFVGISQKLCKGGSSHGKVMVLSDNYRVLGRIGTGGSVYRAQWVSSKQWALGGLLGIVIEVFEC